MASDYPICTIGDVCYVTDGAHAKVERRDNGIPYLTSKNIGHGCLSFERVDYISPEDYDRLFANTSRAHRKPIPGDVLIGIIGTFGNAYLYRESDHFGISSAIALLRPDTRKINPGFLYYVTTSDAFRAAHAAYKSGSVQGYTNIPTIKRLPVPVPTLSEQHAIACTLGALDDKIDLNRRMNETLEAMARAIFKDWFVDFGPVRAKAEGRPPYLAPELWSLFPGALDDDDKPVEWEWSTLGKEVNAVGGATPSTKDPSFWNGDIHWATPKDLSTLQAPVLLDTARRITEAGLSKISSGLLPGGTVLLSSRAPIGYLAIAEVPTAINQGFIAMVCKERLSNIFAWLWCLSSMEAILQNANGSTFQEISKKNFRPIPVIVASEPVLCAFDHLVRPMYSRIVANEHEIRTLTQTRDLLLPKLMSGEIRLREAEKLVEEVA